MRVAGVEHPAELVGLHLALETDGMAARSPPSPGRLIRVDVVVDRPTRQAVAALLVLRQPGVVVDQARDLGAGGLQRRHPEHTGRPPRANALVCCGWDSMSD